ncbi:hypothetical protein B0J17DRAFT_633234 [Rhizoctonia solani]|nr:hypothetical protein B0J17DRAFT_633234 [Rhizoctonia solani]
MAAVTQLNLAHNQLHSALDRYLTVCSSIKRSHAYGHVPQDTLAELMSRVSNELALAHDLGKMLLKARAVLASTRNDAHRVVPMSRLPDDVLVQIFQLITSENDCNAVNNKRNSIYPPQVVMTCKRLWLHVDMPSYLSCNEAEIARAQKYISLAGNCSLDIHLVEPDIERHPPPTSASLDPYSQLLAPISSQIRALDLTFGKPLRSLQCPESSAKRYSPILTTFFKNSKARFLTRLAISLDNTLSGSTAQHYFMEACESSEGGRGIPSVPKGNVTSIAIAQEELDALLFSVTSLELRGLYPRWTSKAYHGLVELRLGAYNGVSIPETDFRHILSSSPRLRHLDFGLKVTRSSTPYSDTTPILLEELETLVTGSRNIEELGLFLRLIHPGSRPLSIYLDKPGRCSSHPDIPRVPFNTQIQTFFARANVEKLGIAGTYNYSQVAELLGLVPRVRVLALSGLCLGNIGLRACAECSNPDLQLDDIYLLRDTTIAQHFLFWLIEAHHVRRLVVTEDSKVTQADDLKLDPDTRSLVDEASLLGCTLESIPSAEHYPKELWN